MTRLDDESCWRHKLSAIVAEYDANIGGSADRSITEICFDDILERLMSILACLPNLPDISPSSIPTASINENDEGSLATYNKEKAYLQFIWDVLCEKPQTTSLPPLYTKKDRATTDPTTGATTVPECDSWQIGLCLANRLSSEHLTATDYHSTAFSSFHFGNNKSRSISTFHITCLFLCCKALQTCPQPLKNRWKRWQSIQLETLELFQRCCFFDNDDSLSVGIWCHYVLPSACLVQRAIESNQDDLFQSPRRMVFFAATISCAAHLAEQHLGYVGATTTHADHILAQISESLADCVLPGCWEWLLLHPRRVSQNNRRIIPRNQTDESRRRTNMDALSSLIINLDSNGTTDRRDLTLGIDTLWSEMGVAILAALGWDRRPCVWSIQYQWELYVPHVNVLLLGEGLDDEEHADECRQNELERTSATNDKSDAVSTHGCNILNHLVQQTTLRSLSQVHSCINSDALFGTCLLLSNRIVQESSLLHRGNPLAVRATLAAQVLKDIAKKCSPMYQLNIVQNLLQRCPHPALKPKLIDLLRDSVFWNDKDAEGQLWLFFERIFLLEMDQLGYASDVPDIIERSEIYQATLGLALLWMVHKRKRPDALRNFLTRLKHAHCVISAIVSSENNSNIDSMGQPVFVSTGEKDIHLEKHRLNLLESGLLTAVQFMESEDLANLNALAS